MGRLHILEFQMTTDDEPEFYEPIRAEEKPVPFFDGLEVDGYQMPDGEFRVSITTASKVLGYAPNWLGRVLERGGNTLKALQGLGFSENLEKVVIKSGRPPETISLRDFNRLISYAVFDGKQAALALQLALTELSLTDFFRDAFGEPPLSIEEKRQLFYEAYAQAISPEHWREMDREDILRLALAGDEPQMQDGRWNQSFIEDGENDA
jgi:hypothetical protein